MPPAEGRIAAHELQQLLGGATACLPMCGSHGHRRGRRGFPDREQLVERLQRYQEHLDGEQKKVKELLERLVDAPQPEPSV